MTTTASQAGAAPPDVVRVQGATRYGTAAAAAARAFPDGATTVVVTTGEKFPDALAANGLAGANSAPILLTARDSLSPETAAALDALDPTGVTIVGGDAAVSQDVEEVLATNHDVTRVAGADRFATAAEVARTLGTAPLIDAGEGAGPLSTVFVANGLNFPDAVAASPALHEAEIPLLLTPTDTLDGDAVEAIGALGAEQVIVLGGPAAVSDGVEDVLHGLGLNVVRLAGATRFETAVDVAEFELDRLGFSAVVTHLATGAKFPDALAGGPLASANDGPLVLTGSLPVATGAFLRDHAADIDQLVVLGGSAAIDGETLDAARVAADPDEDPTADDDPTPDDGAAPGQPEDAAAHADSDSQITLSWHDPASGSPDSFRVHRNGDTCANTTVGELSAVGSVTGDGANTFVDTALAAGTSYCYAVTAVQEGDASTLDATDDAGDSVAEATTASDGLSSTDVRLVSDAGTVGTADAGDVWRIIFDSAVNVTDGDSVRTQDADGEFNDVVLDNSGGLAGDEADWSLNQSPVIIDETTYPARTVLTITLDEALSVEGDADADASNNTGALEYPLTITAQAGIQGDAGDAWTPSNDPDNVTDDEGAQTVNEIAPFIAAGDITEEGSITNVWSEVGDVLTITFSEPVDYVGADADGTAGTQVTEAALVALTGTPMTYGAGSLVTVDGSGTASLTFTVSVANLDEGVGDGDAIDGSPNVHVVDLDGANQIANPDDDPRVAAD